MIKHKHKDVYLNNGKEVTKDYAMLYTDIEIAKKQCPNDSYEIIEDVKIIQKYLWD